VESRVFLKELVLRDKDLLNQLWIAEDHCAINIQELYVDFGNLILEHSIIECNNCSFFVGISIIE
jgi:hypothetical protein